MGVEVSLGGERTRIAAHVLVELTKRCNNRCRHCFTDASPEAGGEEPTPAQLGTLLRSLADTGFGAATLSGGEPMLRRDVDEVVARVPPRFSTWLFTGGKGLDDDRLEAWRGRVEGYAVSIDGGERQHNQLRRSRRSFQDNLAFIKRCARRGVRLQLQSMVLRGRLDQIPLIVELAELVGVERVLFSHVSPDGRGAAMRDEWMDPGELDELQRRIDRLQSATPVVLRTNLMPKTVAAERFPPPTLHVIPSGEVLPWYGVDRHHALGSLGDHGWNLDALLRHCSAGARLERAFSRAREEALAYPGDQVPVDDLLVAAFRSLD